MKQLFVPYELALKAKEKGFDELCFGVWNGIEKKFYGGVEFDTRQSNMPNGCKAPLCQQLVDWFREKYKIIIVINSDDYIFESQFYYLIFHNKQTKTNRVANSKAVIPTYYEALNKALEEAFKLI